MEWRTIETAPKETWILAGYMVNGTWAYSIARSSRDGFGWVTKPGYYGCKPTHWMPLPEPPTPTSPARERP